MIVLVAEDNENSRVLLETVLSSLDYTVLSATNGKEALEHMQNTTPDLIISDILMPEMDGYTLCRAAKKDDRLKNIPFVFYTATYTDPQDEQLAMDLGASRFILKPMEMPLFLNEIHEILNEHKQKNLPVFDHLEKNDIDIEHEYSSVLSKKLEKKVHELECAQAELEDRVKQRTEELAKAKDEAETAYNMMFDFVATVSHELRSPMTSIMGFSQMMNKLFLSLHAEEEAKENKAVRRILHYLEVIREESGRMTSLLDSILDKAKLESGQMEWHFKTVNVEDLVNRAFAIANPQFEAKSLTHRIELQGALPHISCDPERILQVLINILSNAIKHTEKGGVICQAQHVDSVIQIKIIDTGAGIPKEDQQAVFHKYKQTRSTTTPMGTGLGLAISKEIIKHHKGDIWLESTPGQGTTFHFTLPV